MMLTRTASRAASVSGLQRRRCLPCRPKLILLDEPTTGLDRNAWAALMEFVVEEAGKSGACVVFSTHHPRWWRRLPSRVLTLSQGRIADDRLL